MPLQVKQKKIKNNKAITLIALVITIIVLLILAGVTISTLTGENGIITRAKEAKVEHIKAQVKENIETAILEIQTEEIPQGNEVTLQTLHDKLKSKDNNITTKDYVTGEKELKGTYKIDGKEYGFTIDDKLNVKLGNIEQTIEEAFNMTVTNVDKTSLRATGDEAKLNELGATEYTYVASTSTGDIKYEHITTTSYDVTGLEPDTEYTVYMLAYDNAGNVKKSNEVTVTTKNLEIVTTDPYIGTSTTETNATKSAPDRSQKKGEPLYINFNATLEGTNCKISLKGESTQITLPYEVTTNGKVTFVATGTYGSKTITKEIEVTVEKFKIYEIYSPQDLQDMSKDRFGDYIIMNDIDMSGFEFKRIVYSENHSYVSFEGTIDGQGHVISNLKIYNENADSGIFGGIKNSVIKNIIFKEVYIGGNGSKAVLGSGVENSLIQKVGITGNIGISNESGHAASFITRGRENVEFNDCYARTNIVCSGHDAGGLYINQMIVVQL